ncbi:MAG TPA: DNA polymerase III subunit beta [Chloroflexi bacterium]|jgi:DNA polymerase-3 subunit beta|nr:DNA polymerase III subunit beta [Chloroflexota bacterium]
MVKISASQEHLSHALHVAGRAVAARSPLPITTNVLLVTEEGRLRLSATNLDIAISAWLDAEIADEGAITLPSRLLSEFVETLSGGVVDISVKAGGHSAHVTSGRYEATIRGMAADDFPVIPTAGDETAVAVPAGLLKEMVEQVVFAAAMDDTRPILTGALATFSGQSFSLAATDGFRMAMRSGDLENAASGDFSVIIPGRTLAELAKIVPDGDDPVEIAVTPNRNQIVFRTTDLNVVSRLIEGSYPNLKGLVPTKFATKVVVSRDDLLKATKMASYFSRDNSNAITFDIEPGGEAGVGVLAVTGAAAELGEDRGELDAVVNGGGAKVQFNSRYVSDLLGALDSQQVGLEITGPNSAAVFRPIDSVDYTHVIMPMHTTR